MRHIGWAFLVVFACAKLQSQSIHDILVPSTVGISVENARAEFWQYHSLCTNTWTLWYGNDYIRDNFGLNWPSPMIVWDENGNQPVNHPMEYPYTRFTASGALGYIRAWQVETDASKRHLYRDYAQKAAEFLLCLQNATSNGGLPGNPAISLTSTDIHATAHAGVAWIELYLALGDSRYLQASLTAADWQMNNPTYPYGNLGTSGNCPPLESGITPCTFYSNVNHMGLQLWHLSNAYAVTGSQRYLDRCLALAEEIIAWQDYRDSSDPWPNSAIPDGGWYWYDYSANPVPAGSPTPPSNGSFDPNRLMGYHFFVMRGMVALLQAVGQQSLPGTVTPRNGEDFRGFKSRLVSSLIKALNFMIDNQETSSTYFGQYRGGLKHYKNNRHWVSGSFYDNYTTASVGMEAAIDAYTSLARFGENISVSDLTKIRQFIFGMSNGYAGRYSGNFTNSGWAADGQIPGWGKYLEFCVSSTPTPNLLLLNGSFENPKIVWELWSWDGIGVQIWNSFSLSGSKSLHLKDLSTSHSKWASIIVSAQPAQSYEVKAFAKMISGEQYLYLDFINGNFGRIAANMQGIGPTSSFSQVTVDGISPPGTKYVRIWLYAPWYTMSEGYWDNVTLLSSDGVHNQSSMMTNAQFENPQVFALSQNYPNPFNPATVISYQVPVASRVSLKVFNLIGQVVATLVDKEQSAGEHWVSWDAGGIPSGVYVYELRTASMTLRRSMLLLK